jgi:hypothetical protein
MRGAKTRPELGTGGVITLRMGTRQRRIFFPPSSLIRLLLLWHSWRLRVLLPWQPVHLRHRRHRGPAAIILHLDARRSPPLVAGRAGVGTRSARARALVALLQLHAWCLHLMRRRAAYHMGRPGQKAVRRGRAGAHGEAAKSRGSRPLRNYLAVHAGRHRSYVCLHVLVQCVVGAHVGVHMVVSKQGSHVPHYFTDLGSGR